MPNLMAGGAEFVTASLVSDNYFSVLGVAAARCLLPMFLLFELRAFEPMVALRYE
jgi:hypothetical protein